MVRGQGQTRQQRVYYTDKKIWSHVMIHNLAQLETHESTFLCISLSLAPHMKQSMAVCSADDALNICLVCAVDFHNIFKDMLQCNYEISYFKIILCKKRAPKIQSYYHYL